MSEIRPQFTYSPEGILAITAGLNDCFDPASKSPHRIEEMAETRLSLLQTMAEGPATELKESDGVVNLTVDVTERFARTFDIQENTDIASFLRTLDSTLPAYP